MFMQGSSLVKSSKQKNFTSSYCMEWSLGYVLEWVGGGGEGSLDES